MIDRPEGKISSLLNEAYSTALVRHSTLYAELTLLQHRLPIPSDYSTVSAQNYLQFDIVLRSLEDETREGFAADASPKPSLDLSSNILSAWSEMWIMGVYELLRSAKEYSPELIDMELFRDIENVRIPLAKYQIAKERKLDGPLKFAVEDHSNAPEKTHAYAASDPQRFHNLPRALTARGSITWCVIDVTLETKEKWLERRYLSDRFIDYLRSLPQKGSV